jgi:hypothetical protein
MDKLGVKNACCRTHILCPIVLPIGAMYLSGSRTTEDYFNMKPEIHYPRFALLQMKKTLQGESFIVSVTPSGPPNTEGYGPRMEGATLSQLAQNVKGCPVTIVTETQGDLTTLQPTITSNQLNRKIFLEENSSIFDVSTRPSTLS